MKKLLFTILIISVSHATFSQDKGNLENVSTQTLFHRLTQLEKKQKIVNVSLNMKGSFNVDFDDNTKQYGFRMDQIRLQIGGEINSWLSYNYRQRLNRSLDGSMNRDNTSSSLDMAYITVKPTDYFFITMGKQAAAYGGFEFDQNPVDAYLYSNMSSTVTDFTTGVTFGFKIAKKHTLSIQVAEARTNMDELGIKGLDKAEAPFSYSLYWAGSMFKSRWNTIWSASFINDVKGYGRYMFIAGNQIKLFKNISLDADFAYSREEVDVKGILSSDDYRATNVDYLSAVARLNYRFSEKWNIFAKGIFETASYVKGNKYFNTNEGVFGNYIGYAGGLEFYPMSTNLRFFVSYSGGTSNYDLDSVNINGFVNPENHRVSVGFVYKLPIF